MHVKNKKHKRHSRLNSLGWDESPKEGPTNKPSSDALTHAQMCGIADFYDISDLKTLARQKVKGAVVRRWNSSSFIDVLRLVCNPPLERDSELQEIMVRPLPQIHFYWKRRKLR